MTRAAHLRSHESPVQRLLGRLDSVRKSSPRRWYARCPAHNDRNPSLAVTETEDGRVLVYCLAGCTADEVAAAAGLELADLYPRTSAGASQVPCRQRWDHRALLLMVQRECHVVAAAASDLASGHDLTPDDRERLYRASARIARAAEVAT